MKVLYLIGNGFDRNLGLRTSYSDFLSEYVKIPSDNEQINAFKQYLVEQKNNGNELWSDLEILLGASTSNFETPTIFETVLLDVNASLRSYIVKENEKLVFNNDAHDRFISYLLNPHKYLTNANQRNLSAFVKYYGNTWDIDFMSFNYTYSVEKLLGDSIGKEIGKNAFGGVTKVNSVKHIHGVCDETILVGLNDASQMVNAKFRDNQRLIRKFIKPKTNETIGELVDVECQNLIRNANIICCFGLSFGKTDSIWWDMIINSLNSDSHRVIVYDYKADLDITNNKWELGDGKEEVCNRIFRNNSHHRLDQILYALNTDMFSGLTPCVKGDTIVAGR